MSAHVPVTAVAPDPTVQVHDVVWIRASGVCGPVVGVTDGRVLVASRRGTISARPGDVELLSRFMLCPGCNTYDAVVFGAGPFLPPDPQGRYHVVLRPAVCGDCRLKLLRVRSALLEATDG